MTRDDIKGAISMLESLRKDIYDFDYDEYALWHIDEAINHLKNAII